MGILSGYKRFKKYLRTGEGYKLCSEWTKSDSVEMDDGSTLQEYMDNITSDIENTQNDITDVHNELMTSLGGMTFGVDAAGRYGYIKAGADTVTPFKKNDWETLTTENIKEYSWGDSRTYSGKFPSTTFQSPSASRIVTSLGITDTKISESAKIIGFKNISVSSRPGYGGVSGVSLNDGIIRISFHSDGDLTNTPVTAAFNMIILVYIPS